MIMIRSAATGSTIHRVRDSHVAPERLGRSILSLEELERARDHKRAVICPEARCFARPIPAAFIMNMAATIVLRLIRIGLFVYERGEQ